MQIKIIKATALKGKGMVSVGELLDENDADPVELKRLVAYGKAEFADIKPTPKAQKTEKPNEDGPKINISKGLNTKTAGAIK